MDKIKLEDHPNSTIWADLVRQQHHEDYKQYVPKLVLLYETIIKHDSMSSTWSKFTDVIFERYGTQSYQVNRYYKISNLATAISKLDL